jgi:S1-C subfamily serine protease
MKYWKILIITVMLLAFAGLASCTGRQGPPGAGVTGAAVDGSGHLVLTLSDGKTIDAGSVAVNPGVQLSTTTMTMGDLFTLVTPVIVRIDVAGPGFLASGSGIIIRSDGYVITNQHVVDGATSIAVTLSTGKQYPAVVHAGDANVDLAILKLTGSPVNLPVANLGTVSDIVVGGVVMAGGFPLGTTLPGPPSYAQGVVSAVRSLDGQKYIQTDVQINPGNSGGALVARTSGKVIGMTADGVLPPGKDIEGIGLAIPIDVIQTYIQNNLK